MKEVHTQIWAHRGASGYAPENTMKAFQLAHELGADGIELDVQICKSGELVVIHDERIDRTTNSRGFVRDYTLSELRVITNNQIPTLKEVLVFARATNMIVNIELKTGIFFYPEIEEKVIGEVAKYEMKEKVVYSSFNHYTLKRLKALDPTCETGMLFQDVIYDSTVYAKQLGVSAIHPPIYNLQIENLIDNSKKAGLKIHVWTVNEEKDMQFMCENQIDAMITNYPDKAKIIRDNYQTSSYIL